MKQQNKAKHAGPDVKSEDQNPCCIIVMLRVFCRLNFLCCWTPYQGWQRNALWQAFAVPFQAEEIGPLSWKCFVAGSLWREITLGYRNRRSLDWVGRSLSVGGVGGGVGGSCFCILLFLSGFWCYYCFCCCCCWYFCVCVTVSAGGGGGQSVCVTDRLTKCTCVCVCVCVNNVYTYMPDSKLCIVLPLLFYPSECVSSCWLTLSLTICGSSGKFF